MNFSPEDIRKEISNQNYRAPILVILRISPVDAVYERAKGFCAEMSERFPDWTIVPECIYPNEASSNRLALIKRHGWIEDINTLNTIKERSCSSKSTICFVTVTSSEGITEDAIPVSHWMLFSKILLESATNKGVYYELFPKK